MRRYGIGLQLVLLVCSGVASGYIWHAALASKRSSIRFVFIGPPYEQTQLAPAPRIRPTLTHTRAGKRHVRAVATSSGHTRHVAHARSAPQRRPPATRLASAPVHSSELATHPAAKHPAHPARPPIKLRKPAPPPASPPPSPPSPAAERVQAAAASKGKRPGWGHGDRNHDHTGPTGQASADRGQSSEHEHDHAKKPKAGK